MRGIRLGAWSVRELQTPLGPLAVGLEETTYLTVVCPLFTLPDFLVAFASSTAIALRDLGVASRDAGAEATAIVTGARFAKNDNRSLLGSVNDVAFHVAFQRSLIRLGPVRLVARVPKHQRGRIDLLAKMIGHRRPCGSASDRTSRTAVVPKCSQVSGTGQFGVTLTEGEVRPVSMSGSVTKCLVARSARAAARRTTRTERDLPECFFTRGESRE